MLGDTVTVPIYSTDKRHWRSVATKIRPEPENGHGTEAFWRAAAGIRVQCYAGHVISWQLIVKTMPSLFVMTGVLVAGYYFKSM